MFHGYLKKRYFSYIKEKIIEITNSKNSLISLLFGPLFYYLIVFFLFWRWLLYSVVLISAIQQHESALDRLMYPPSWTSFPAPTPSHPSMLLQSTKLSNWCSTSYTATSHHLSILHVKVKVTQPCPTLCYPMGYTVHGILQARTLEWVAFPASRGSSKPRDWTQVSCIAGRFFTSWATREAPILHMVVYMSQC